MAEEVAEVARTEELAERKASPCNNAAAVATESAAGKA